MQFCHHWLKANCAVWSSVNSTGGGAHSSSCSLYNPLSLVALGWLRVTVGTEQLQDGPAPGWMGDRCRHLYSDPDPSLRRQRDAKPAPGWMGSRRWGPCGSPQQGRKIGLLQFGGHVTMANLPESSKQVPHPCSPSDLRGPSALTWDPPARRPRAVGTGTGKSLESPPRVYNGLQLALSTRQGLLGNGEANHIGPGGWGHWGRRQENPQANTELIHLLGAQL